MPSVSLQKYNLNRVSTVREIVRENIFFNVRELSWTFEESQEFLEFKQKSGKSQGILKYQVREF